MTGPVVAPSTSCWTGIGDDEDLVAEILRHKSDRDPFERLSNEHFNARFRKFERYDRNLTKAPGQLDNLVMQRDRMLDPVHGINSCCDEPVDLEVTATMV